LALVENRRAVGDADKCMAALVKRAVRAYMMVIDLVTEEAARSRLLQKQSADCE
jgi:hypothetical protein